MHQSRSRLASRFAGYFPNETQDEALARLHFLAENHRRMGLLTGASGCGKTLVLERFRDELAHSRKLVAHVNLTCLDEYELLTSIAHAWGESAGASVPLRKLWRKIEDRLASCQTENLPAIVLADDADAAGDETLSQMARLVRAADPSGAPLLVVLSGGPSLPDRLPAALAERVELRVELDAWDIETTAQFVESLPSADGRRRAAFSREAICDLHRRTQGRVRRLRQLAELCLVAASGHGLAHIDEQTVEQVETELAMA